MNLLVKLLKISPKVAILKVISKITEKFSRPFKLKRLHSGSTYSSGSPDSSPLKYTFLPLPEIDELSHYEEDIFTSAALSSLNKFDLLGSGIVKVSHNSKYNGFEGSIYDVRLSYQSKEEYAKKYINDSNIEKSVELFKQLPEDYELIDWQRDIRSGFRWEERFPSLKISYGKNNGADIKLPWEIGRLQHLIPLVYAYYIEKSRKRAEKASKYLSTIRNHFFDFRASNPPHFGCQWMTCMDVAIRAFNLLVCFDFLKQSSAELDKDWLESFAETFDEHYKFIAENLEWSSGMRGNHYLAGISSKLVLELFVDSIKVENKDIEMSINSLIEETFYQFAPDGGNFESSTSYHKFSFEMLFFAYLALFSMPTIKLKTLNEKSFGRKKEITIINDEIVLSNRLVNQLYKIFEFTVFSTGKSKYVPQFGDNDSGFFAFISPIFVRHLDERAELRDMFYTNTEDAWHVLSLFAGYFNEYMDNSFFTHYTEYSTGLKLRMRNRVLYEINQLADTIRRVNHYLNEITDSSVVRSNSFKDFGLYSVRRKKYTFLFKCSSLGQRGKGGHNHNDALSFEMLLGDIPFIVDAGTYCYTSNFDLRNHYRSTKMHNSMTIASKEQNKWDTESKDSLFWLSDGNGKPTIEKFTESGLISSHYYFGKKYTRMITFESDGVNFIEKYPQNIRKELRLHLAPGIEAWCEAGKCIISPLGKQITLVSEGAEVVMETYDYSPHYGIKQKALRILLKSEAESFSWTLKL